MHMLQKDKSREVRKHGANLQNVQLVNILTFAEAAEKVSHVRGEAEEANGK